MSISEAAAASGPDLLPLTAPPPKSSAAENLPGDLAIWIFIFAELLVFAVFFAAYGFARANDVELFNTMQATLDRNVGLANTLLLIGGSWCVARACFAVRHDLSRSGSRWLAAGIACGLGFVVLKMFEFADKIGAGISLSTNTFYMFYLSLTFFHFMHVLLGLVILAILWVKTHRGEYGRANHSGLESGGAYWHMVDLVWLILFPLVYVIR